ncbi:MAG: nucleotidyltransferase family protein [Oscillospiraceae bacterium]|nr:nucleotidyltransferase family protein [Oscillospiraceae bacterium]
MGKIIGIVAEYNPFHAGHAYQIAKAREWAGEDSTVIAVMSGDFVQRGEWAIQPKAMRALSACRGGADAVFELPLPWCLSSAEGFARGAVSLLCALGITHLSFGSETADLEKLAAAAEKIAAPGFAGNVKACLRVHPNLTYPQARDLVLGQDAVSSPNDVLGVEYLLALKDQDVIPLPVKRIGSGHDELGEGVYPSATEIRSRILSGVMREPHADPSRFELVCLSRLRMLSKEAFLALPDCADGLGSRLYEAVREGGSLLQICDRAKTRRYTHSRVRRAVMCASLGISRGDAEGMPPYARLLAMNERGRAFLSSLKGKTKVPVITLPKELETAGTETASRLFALGASAHDLYMLSFPPYHDTKCGEDYRTGPSIV